MTELTKNTGSKEASKQDQWFEALINTIKVDQLQLQTKTASKETTWLYTNIIEENHPEIFSNLRTASSHYFIAQLITTYIQELKNRNVTTSQLAFDLSDANVLVWAEISDTDEDSENGLILAEAKTNAEFSQHGFHISSTIVEKGDNLSVPSHYRSTKN